MRRVIRFDVHNCELQTPCPYGRKNDEGETVKVNSFDCHLCDYFGLHNDYGKIYCYHRKPKENE